MRALALRALLTVVAAGLRRFYAKVKIYVGYPPYPPRGAKTVAAFIATRSARYKTRSGVGVGSSLLELRHRVTVRCHRNLCRHARANFNLPSTVFDIDPTTTRITEIAIVPGAATGRCEPTSGFCVRATARGNRDWASVSE